MLQLQTVNTRVSEVLKLGMFEMEVAVEHVLAPWRVYLVSRLAVSDDRHLWVNRI